MSICLPCLTHHPSLILTCGHRFCRQCVQELSHHLSGAEVQLARCFLCCVANDAPIYIKPVAAGLRVLKLSSGIRDTASLTKAVKRLEQALGCPLYLHFDLVIGIGMGKILAQAMFSKDGKIKDFLPSASDSNKWENWQLAGTPDLEGTIELPSNRLTILADW